MEFVGGLVLLVAASVLVWLGRPTTDGLIAMTFRNWRLESVLAVVATALVGLGVALVINGAVGFLP